MLLLITNRIKSYTDFPLPLRAMILNIKIGVFQDFWRLWRNTFQERIALNSLQMRMKFSALNVDFNDLSFDLMFKETCARGHQRAALPKSRYLTVVGQFTVKTVADRHGHAAYHNKHYSDELFSRINIDDFKRP